MTTKTKRGFILDLILAVGLVVIILTGALTSIADLVTKPDRPLVQIAFDWLIVVITTAAVILSAYFARCTCRAIDAAAAKREANEAAEIEARRLSDRRIETNVDHPAVISDEDLRRISADAIRRGY